MPGLLFATYVRSRPADASAGAVDVNSWLSVKSFSHEANVPEVEMRP